MIADPVCPRCASRDIVGVEIRDVYDGVLYWQCQTCRRRFHRFSTARMRVKAEPYVTDPYRPA